MSYILEALRKADAERERERGAVPDLHTQLPPPAGADASARPPRTALLPWLAVGALLAIVAGGAWHLLRRDAPAAVAVTPAAAPAAAAVPAAAAPAPPAPPPAAQGPQTPMPAGPSAAAVPPPAAASPAPAAAAARPAAPAAVPPLAATKPAASRRPPQAAAAPPSPKLPPVPKPPPPAPVRLPALAELPADLRRQVPPLAVGGSVYSPQASARMVIVNGQVFQEGSSLTPELKLEQIRPKSAVFSIGGTRFELPL